MTLFPVSSGNPCPMLRALVASGHIPDNGEQINSIATTLGKVRGGDEATNKKFRKTVKIVAMAANGLWPWDLIHNAVSGVRIDKLRGGPLDKHGVGSGILDAQAQCVSAQLDRLSQFSSFKTDLDNMSELGLDAAQIKAMMDDNFERAAGKRRKIDRKLMNAEWPLLLEIFGKPSAQGLYLSLGEVRTLFVDRKMPARIEARLA